MITFDHMTRKICKKKIKYDCRDFDPKTLDVENIDRLAVENVLPGSLVLDVGCATGFMGEYLIKEKSCQVFGIEKRLEEAAIAKNKLNGMLIADVEDEDNLRSILQLTKNKKFDVILATSVIEHLVNPVKFILSCKKILSPKGIIIASTPNMAHWTIRLALLCGKFDYSNYGILDNTHLHFFTINTFCSLFADNKYKVRKLLIDSVGGGYPRFSRFFSKWFPGLFAYQILVVAENIL